MTSLHTVPLFERLRAARSVLIAGAGGGYDVYAGVPLYLHLRAAGVAAHLANMTFTDLALTDAQEVCEGLRRVSAQTMGARHYFPEKWLCEWLEARGESAPTVWALEGLGVKQARGAYAWLAESLSLDAVVLVDGGTDILMRGDEQGLGTPQEDVTSLAAVSTLTVPTRALVCVGFGIDAHHGVCHSHFLENTAALAKDGAFWGVSSLLAEMPEVAAWLDLVRSVHAAHYGALSIVNGSIAAAVEGQFGDWHFTHRTASSELYINPLMALCWAYDLGAVAARSLSIPEVLETESMAETSRIIDAVNVRNPRRAPRTIPV